MQTFCKVLQPSKCKKFLYCSCKHFNFMVIFYNKMLDSDGQRLKVTDDWTNPFSWGTSATLKEKQWVIKTLLRPLFGPKVYFMTIISRFEQYRPFRSKSPDNRRIPGYRLVRPCPGSLNPISGLIKKHGKDLNRDQYSVSICQNLIYQQLYPWYIIAIFH